MSIIAKRPHEKQPSSLRSTDVIIYVPSGFDPEILPPHLRRYADCARYLLHLIVRGRVFMRQQATPLKAEYLREFIPLRVEKPLREALADTGVIEIDRHFQIGRHAMHYRLAPPYASRPASPYAVQDRRLADRLAKHRNTHFRDRLTLDVHKHLRSQLDRVQIDASGAQRCILGTPELAENADIHTTAIRMIQDRYWQFCFCRMGRVHTLITRLARQLRQYLHVDGRPLVGVDVACCQPLLLAALVSSGNAPLASTRKPFSSNRIPKDPYLNAHRIGLGFLSPLSSVSAGCHRDDAARYARLCESGVIYEHLGDLVGWGSGSRDKVKRELMVVMFGEVNRMGCPVGRAIDQHFPSIGQFIRKVKARDYTHLACLLQNIEARIIINDACRRLMHDHPEVPVITIHDSIITTPEHVDTIATAMRAAFAEIGLSPSLKIERSAPPVEVN